MYSSASVALPTASTVSASRLGSWLVMPTSGSSSKMVTGQPQTCGRWLFRRATGDPRLEVGDRTALALASRGETTMPEFVDVAQVDSVPPGTATVVTAKGIELALVNVNGDFHAVDNECTHLGGYLGEGEINPDGRLSDQTGVAGKDESLVLARCAVVESRAEPLLWRWSSDHCLRRSRGAPRARRGERWPHWITSGRPR